MSSPFALLKTRRFAPMFLCTCLGAFNDNYFKNALIILITYQLAQQAHMNPATVISYAMALFIVPFFLLSGIAGKCADKYPKHQLVRWLKITELMLFIAALLALLSAHIIALLVILTLLGVQAACFGPVKYAILPTLLAREELVAGNGLTEAGTFISILLGTTLGGLLILAPYGHWIVGGSMVLMGILGVVASRYVPAMDTGNPSIALSLNPFSTTWNTLRAAYAKADLWWAIVGISWFWAVGATYLTQLPVFTKQVIGGNQEIVTLFMAMFSIGVGIGSLACNHLIKGTLNVRYVPWALLGIALTGLDLWYATAHLPPKTTAMIGLESYLSHSDDWRLIVDLALLSICGGLFIVPLYTLLQVRSEEHVRAQTIASNNIMNALFITIASVAAAAAYQWGFTVKDVFLATALLCLILALAALIRLRNVH